MGSINDQFLAIEDIEHTTKNNHLEMENLPKLS